MWAVFIYIEIFTRSTMWKENLIDLFILAVMIIGGCTAIAHCRQDTKEDLYKLKTDHIFPEDEKIRSLFQQKHADLQAELAEVQQSLTEADALQPVITMWKKRLQSFSVETLPTHSIYTEFYLLEVGLQADVFVPLEVRKLPQLAPEAQHFTVAVQQLLDGSIDTATMSMHYDDWLHAKKVQTAQQAKKSTDQWFFNAIVIVLVVFILYCIVRR